MANAAKIPYVIQDNFVSVVVGGRPFQLLASHPTFKKMVKALRAKAWTRVPDLVTVAQSISNRSHGNIDIKNGEVYYKGSPVHSALTKMMLNLIEHNKPVTHMMKFMDNLYKNPNEHTKQELYGWLERNNMPITDDGCFVAYKRVNDDYTDCYTATIDNHVGQVVSMPRKTVDDDVRSACSMGYHLCSRGYLGYFNPGDGYRLMAIKVNPADVVAVPEANKVRGWRYEVIAEIPNGNYREFDAEYFQNPLITVNKDRNQLIKKLLALPAVKRLLARTERTKLEYAKNRRKLGDAHHKVEVAGLTKEAIRKASFGRLQTWYQRFTANSPVLPGLSAVFNNPTRPLRVAAKLTITQVAKEMGMKASVVFKGEQSLEPTQSFIDNYLAAIQRLKNAPAGITYGATKSAAA